MSSRRSSSGRWGRRSGLALRLFGRFLGEMVVSNLEQARLVLRSPLALEPRWIDYRTCLRTTAGRTLLGALVSMTPGTLTCDLQGDRLEIHLLDAPTDEAAARAQERIRDRFESLLVKMEEP